MPDPSARSSPPRWLLPMNRVFIGLNRLGLGPKEMSFLTVKGRISGKPRTTPLSVFSVDGRRYVVGGFPGADWVANVRAAGGGLLRQGRQNERVWLRELTPEESRPILRAFHDQVPTSLEFLKGAGLVTTGTADEYEALAGTCAVFRIELAEG